MARVDPGTQEAMVERGAWAASMAGSPPPPQIFLGRLFLSGGCSGGVVAKGSGEPDGTSRGSVEPDGASRGSGEPDGTSRGSGELDGTSRGSGERCLGAGTGGRSLRAGTGGPSLGAGSGGRSVITRSVITLKAVLCRDIYNMAQAWVDP